MEDKVMNELREMRKEFKDDLNRICDKIDARFDKIDSRFGKIEGRVASIVILLSATVQGAGHYVKSKFFGGH